MATTPDFHGLYPPLTTPFAPDGSVSLSLFRENIARYNRTRLAGYVITGSTGESLLLRWEEMERVWETAREAAASGKIMIAGTAAEATAETIEHTSRAAELGYDAALVRTPHYYRPQMNPDALAEYYLRVADAARIPILIYSVPIFTQLAVEAPLALRLAQHPNIAGMKDSSGNLKEVAAILDGAPPGFRLLVGSARTFCQSLEKGAAGGILAVSCALPELCVEIYEAHRAGDSARARSLQEKLMAPAEVLGPRYGIPGLKYAMDRLGYHGGPPRPPLLPIDSAAQREIDAMLAGLVPESAVRR